MKIGDWETIDSEKAKDKLIRRKGLTFVESTCKHCGATFKRRKGLTNVYCSRQCNGLHNFPHQPIDKAKQDEIQRLRKEGLSSYIIALKLKIARNTVMKYWDAEKYEVAQEPKALPSSVVVYLPKPPED